MEGIWCDGGCVGRNPSKWAGTWAFVHVFDGKVIGKESGIVLPKEVKLPKITNNLTELYAAMKALAYLGTADWTGRIYTDSQVTLHRITTGTKFAGIPDWMVDNILNMRRHRKWSAKLVGGHPTKRELIAGFNRRGKPVSKWNVACDVECQRLARKFLEELE